MNNILKSYGPTNLSFLIYYIRGHITILDRLGLEATVYACYQVVKQKWRGQTQNIVVGLGV